MTAERDDEMRQGNEQQMTAFVRATTKKEKVGLERMMVIESAIRDIAAATAGAMAQLQVRGQRPAHGWRCRCRCAGCTRARKAGGRETCMRGRAWACWLSLTILILWEADPSLTCRAARALSLPPHTYTHTHPPPPPQGKIDRGVADLGSMVDAARAATEGREGALREQVNAALARIRAYARDMEVSRSMLRWPGSMRTPGTWRAGGGEGDKGGRAGAKGVYVEAGWSRGCVGRGEDGGGGEEDICF